MWRQMRQREMDQKGRPPDTGVLRSMRNVHTSNAITISRLQSKGQHTTKLVMHVLIVHAIPVELPQKGNKEHAQ